MTTYKRDPISDKPRFNVPSDEKHSTQIISILVGVLLSILGLSGLLYPGFAGLHLGPLHALIIAFAGLTLLYYGSTNKGKECFLSCSIFGAYFILASLAGFILGNPGTSTIAGAEGIDGKLLVIIPRMHELGSTDHIVNLMIGLVLMGGALDWWRRNQGLGGVLSRKGDQRFNRLIKH